MYLLASFGRCGWIRRLNACGLVESLFHLTFGTYSPYTTTIVARTSPLGPTVTSIWSRAHFLHQKPRTATQFPLSLRRHWQIKSQALL